VGLSTFITGDVYGWGYLMAGAVLTTLPVIVVYTYLQRYISAETSTKGYEPSSTRASQTGGVADGSFGRDLVEAARTARNET
jgi:hypothetical protein